MKRTLLTCLLFLFIGAISAQDFQCQVSVNANQVTGNGNQQRYNDLQQKLYTFIHERKWCQYTLKTNERIECALQINLTEVAGDVMKGTMNIILQRPVYKASYKTTLVNFQDKNIQFTYAEGDPLEYADNTNLSQFTSLIAYYLNLFLAVEFDSFSMNGGAPYYNNCQSIVNLNQSSKEKGWNVAESGQNNRYWITENLTNSTYSKVHDFYYQYHRLGLDVMNETPDAGRAVILESLKLLQQVNAQKSNLAIVRIICNTKYEEIINIFKEGMPSEKTQVVNIMKQIDPTNSSKYDAINSTSK
ncbi:MAG: DUF4835 family protein [Bacteroidales bacterium]|nr:DUF4835 family protein [Bacteroidales bacterium]